MDGVLNVRKPSGPTSHDVVDEIRRIFGRKRVGHAGTLDPLAEGVLVVCLGKATRVVEYLMGMPKEYRARMVLGVSTDTQDSAGTIISERDASAITREDLERVVTEFVGEIEQTPPMTSAVKHEGKRLYHLARQGKTVARPARKVTIYSIEVIDFEPRSGAPNTQYSILNTQLIVRCSTGVYIRTLCSDIGDRLGCGAHMSALERTSVGRFRVEDSVTIDDLRKAGEEGRLNDLVMSVDDALADLPAVTVDEDDVPRVTNGVAVPCSGIDTAAPAVRIHPPNGLLLGIGEVSTRAGGSIVQPRKVLAVLAPNTHHPSPETEGVV